MTAWRDVLSIQYLVRSTRCVGVAFVAAVIASFFLAPQYCYATDPPPDPIQAGKDALSSGGRFPWYDRRQDDVRRLNLMPRQSSDDPGTQWTAAPATAPTKTTRNKHRWA